MNTINHTVKISLQMNASFLGKQGRDRLPANSVGNTGQAKRFLEQYPTPLSVHTVSDAHLIG